MTDDLSSLLSEILSNARQLLSAEGGSIFLREGNLLVMRVSTGQEAESPRRISYDVGGGGGGLTGWVAQHQSSLIINDLREIQQWQPSYDQVESQSINNLVAAPIMSDEEVIGVIRCTNKQAIAGEAFGSRDAEILQAFAKTAAAATAPYMFVLMPFHSDFADVYELGIKSVARSLGFRCERVDEIEFNDMILEAIYKGIQSADIVVAEMTGRNPNVFYEVGYAHALSKEVVLLTKDAADIPFDLKAHNHIVYNGHIMKLRDS